MTTRDHARILARGLRDELYIDGVWGRSSSATVIEVVDPATGQDVRELHGASASDVDAAVTAAARAFPAWATRPAAERAGILRRLADLVDAAGDDLAALDTLDNGKPFTAARQIDVVQSVRHLRQQAAYAEAQSGQSLRPATQPLTATVTREPVGVVALITPWNYPLLMIVRALAPALAAGNTVVVKPAELTPLSAIAVVGLCERAGVPAGVVNLVSGTGAEAGAALAAHPRVDMITFTGGLATADRIRWSTTARTTFELGGKAPYIVFADADLDAAAATARGAAFGNQGQNCMAAARFLVADAVADRFQELLTAATRDVRVGDGFDPSTACGPLISPPHRARVAGMLDDAVAAGCTHLTGGESRGHAYFTPALVTDVPVQSALWREEVFGPVALIRRFGSDEEAIELANDTRYGLAAAVWTADPARAAHTARALRAGLVWTNAYARFDAAVPFAPRGASGSGVVGGVQAFETYTALKTTWTA